MFGLVTLPPAFGLRNVSPFCLKAEMLLTALDIPFTLSTEANPNKAPKGKLPYLKHEGKIVADSELIAEYLDAYTGGKIYADLTPEQRATGVALTRLCEDHLYWIMVASRWLDDAWWPNVVAGFFGDLPAIIRPVATGIARRQVRQTYCLQGLGRHSRDEQEGFLRRDLDALEAAVPTEGYLFGQQPDVYDFTVAGMMAGIYDNEPAMWTTEIVRTYSNLHNYCERVQDAVGVWARK